MTLYLLRLNRWFGDQRRRVSAWVLEHQRRMYGKTVRRALMSDYEYDRLRRDNYRASRLGKARKWLHMKLYREPKCFELFTFNDAEELFRHPLHDRLLRTYERGTESDAAVMADLIAKVLFEKRYPGYRALFNQHQKRKIRTMAYTAIKVRR